MKPVILGSSFGGHVVLTYRRDLPGHAAGIILANTTGGPPDYRRSVEIFRRLGGDEAAAVAERDFAELSAESLAEVSRRVCLPLYSSRPMSRRRGPGAAGQVNPDDRCQPALLP